MVNLQDFISETLSQIISGVEDAQKRAAQSEAAAAVAPIGQGTRDETLLNQMVEFDIGVMAESGKNTAGGIGITVGAVALGSTGKSSSGQSATNRVKFSVPIHLPGQRVPKS